jgi:hypothetical protein
MTNQTDALAFTADIAERVVRITWPDNKRGGATPPSDGWQARAWAQERTLHEIDEGSVSGCSILRWRDDPRSDAELLAVSLALVAGTPVSSVGQASAPDQTPLRDRIAEAAFTAVEAALGDTLVPAAREQALAGIAAVLPSTTDQTAVRPGTLRAIARHLEGRAVTILRPESEAYAEYNAVAALLRCMADETQPTETCPTPETHNWGCGCPSDEHPAALGTLPAWLHWRFGPHGQPWADVPDEDKTLWEHQARAVRRAVARGGFKQPAAGARQDGVQS